MSSVADEQVGGDNGDVSDVGYICLVGPHSAHKYVEEQHFPLGYFGLH